MLWVNVPPEKLLEAMRSSFLVSTLSWLADIRSVTCKFFLISSATGFFFSVFETPKTFLWCSIQHKWTGCTGMYVNLRVIIFIQVASFIQFKRNVSWFFSPSSINRNACLMSFSRKKCFNQYQSILRKSLKRSTVVKKVS